jgi:uncharacterized protein
VGKSKILMQIRDELTQKNSDANVIYIDKEKYEFDHIADYNDLMKFVSQNRSDGLNCLFIDEVQEIAQFEKALRSLLSEGNFDIYCTGSNAQIFSSNISTYLSGRHIETKVHALSYPEFLNFHGLAKNMESLSRFLQFGGLPYLIHLPQDVHTINEYLTNLNSTILYRDVIGRHNIRDVVFLNNLLKYAADNTGSLLSVNNIHKYLKSQKSTKSVSVIVNYLNHLVEANLINRTCRMEVQGLKIFEAGEKFYFEDIGIRNSIIGYKAQDINKIIENAVYNHLNLNGYEVFIGKMGNKEIDFIAQKDNERVYFQVAYKLSDEKVIKREFGNLDEIKDHYPKFVISMDDFPIETSYKGIKHKKLIDFLYETKN